MRAHVSVCVRACVWECVLRVCVCLNEYLFCLKTGVDDFKHESCKLYTVFLDFRDAFGTLSQKMMLSALEEIHVPQPFVDIITSAAMALR